jgi:SAM-dependent methyltransferase
MSGRALEAAALPAVHDLLAAGDAKACCAALYEHPAIRWLLGGELHPGGAATTRRALELIGLGPGDRLLDVASGTGDSALLAARELGCGVVGVDYSDRAVLGANEAADVEGPAVAAGFVQGDAEALPLPDASFDAVLCECSLSSFPDKRRALGEIRRVLRTDGRLALSDVVADRDRLPEELSGPLAALACVGEAQSARGYERLLVAAGFRPTAIESRDEDAAALAERVEDRLRGARLLGLDRASASPIATADAIEVVGAARRAIADGSLGYAIFAATLQG